jgi:hypothetical protein
MEPLERRAAYAGTIELRVDSYVVTDRMEIEDYRGPELIVLAHAGRVVEITASRRTLVELAPERMHELLELAIAAEHEPHREGVDTATARPVTRYRLCAERVMREHRFTASRQVNHLVPHALAPRWSALIAALREAAGPPADPRAAEAWDVAAAFVGPIELGPVWTAGGVVQLPRDVTAFEHDGPVYLRVGQPPGRSALYCYDRGLVYVADERRVVPRSPFAIRHPGERWLMPCGGGSVQLCHEWQRPLRFVAHAFDPARPIFVQRG